MTQSDTINNILQKVVSLNNYELVEVFDQPARPERTRPVPEGYRGPIFFNILNSLGLPANTLWTQQAEALDVIENGMSAVLSTPTASGKTLVFQLAALKKIIDDPNARILGFYPTRALNGDQRLSWQQVIQAAGLPEETIALLDGSVDKDQRLNILTKSRIAIMTPDVVHAWLMPNLHEPIVQEFVANIQLKILDEAHLYDGSFGTHFAYLLGRLKYAQTVINKSYTEEKNGQIIAASATMDNPEEFLKALTGNDFYSIGPEWDGSPRHQSRISLVGVPNFRVRDATERLLTSLGSQNDTPGITICFVDSRVGVDEIANKVNAKLLRDDEQQIFASYRGGYNPEDRLEIEAEIRSGKLKGVITTSALEVGINIKGVRQVVMAGLPDDTASFRQRMGRVRAGGDIIIFEELSRIKDLGLSLKSKMSEPPRQPILYLRNPKLVAEQAVCFLQEAESLGVGNIIDALHSSKLVRWPSVFKDTVSMYLESDAADLPDMLQKALPPRGFNSTPQMYHALRSFDGPFRRILRFDPATSTYRSLGEVTQMQAMTESYPGAVVHFRGRSFRVKEWSRKATDDRNIFVRPLTDEERADRIKTRGFVKTSIITYLNDLCITGDRFKSNEFGDFITDTRITIQRTISGFSELRGKKYSRIFYGTDSTLSTEFTSKNGQEVLITDKYQAPKMQAHDTTGVIIRIQAPWFHKAASRRLGIIMQRALCDQFNISPKDISMATRNIKVAVDNERYVEDKALIIYDKTPGSLYLTRKLFDHFPAIIERMIDLCEDAGMEKLILNLHDWYESLRFKPVLSYDSFAKGHIRRPLEQTECIAFTPGSVLNWTPKKGDAPKRVKVDAVDFTRGVLVYQIREAEFGYNPFRLKGDKSIPAKAIVPAHAYLSKHFVAANQLEAPDAPIYRYGVFDTLRKKFVSVSVYGNDNADPGTGIRRTPSI